MFPVNSISFNTDRFGNPNEALDLSSGYTFLTPGFFFTSPQFSISLWIYPNSNGWSPSNSVLLDFGNSNTNGNSFLDDIILNYVSTDNIGPNVQIYNYSTLVMNAKSSITLVNYQWQLLTITYDGVTLKVSINGTVTGSVKKAYSLPVIARMNNYFGATYSNRNQNSYLRLDEIRFYNICLTRNQILEILNIDNSANNGKNIHLILKEKYIIYNSS